MGELILVRVVELDLVVLEEVLVVVREDRVDAAHVVAAEVRAEHDRVRRVTAKVGLVNVAREKLDVAAAAERVLLLLVLHRELDDKRLVDRRRRGRHLGRDAVVAHVLRGLETLRDLLVGVPLARRELPLSHLILHLGLDPSVGPALIIEGLLKVDRRERRGRREQQ